MEQQAEQLTEHLIKNKPNTISRLRKTEQRIEQQTEQLVNTSFNNGNELHKIKSCLQFKPAARLYRLSR